MRIKDAGLRIRLDRELRDAFIATCRQCDKPAAQVLREFMRQYVEARNVANDRVRRKPARRGSGSGK
jgi:hypothetical protein